MSLPRVLLQPLARQVGLLPAPHTAHRSLMPEKMTAALKRSDSKVAKEERSDKSHGVDVKDQQCSRHLNSKNLLVSDRHA